MPELHLENVPDELYSRLERLARSRKHSFADEAIQLLRDAVSRQEATERERMRAQLDEIQRTRVPVPPGTPDSVELLREDRER